MAAGENFLSVHIYLSDHFSLYPGPFVGPFPHVEHSQVSFRWFIRQNAPHHLQQTDPSNICAEQGFLLLSGGARGLFWGQHPSRRLVTLFTTDNYRNRWIPQILAVHCRQRLSGTLFSTGFLQGAVVHLRHLLQNDPTLNSRVQIPVHQCDWIRRCRLPIRLSIRFSGIRSHRPL